MPIKGVIFDLDGTLLDREQSLRLFIANQYERFIPLHHVDRTLFINRFMELDNYGYVWKDKVYQCLLKELAIVRIDWVVLLMDYIRHFQLHCVPFPNLIETIETLKAQHIKLALVSNGYGQFQYNNFKSLHIEHYFDAVLISEWEGIRKPEKEIFIRALQKMNVRPEEALCVGDHPDKDIKPTHQMGLKTVWKKSLPFVSCPDSDYQIDDLAELIPIIDRYNH